MPQHAPSVFAELRAAVAAVEARARSGCLAFGVGGVDGRLLDGGLARDAVHDVSSATSSLADVAAATLFVAGAASRLAEGAGPVLWIAVRFDLYAPGLEQAGLSADRVLYAEAGDDAEALALAEDALSDGAPGAVVAEVARASMASTRRLQLACERAGLPLLTLRRWRRRGICPLSEPSAAATRWRVGCAPSKRLSVPGLGRARWSVELVRQRGGAPFSLELEACDGEGRLAVAAAAADRAAASVGAPAARAA